MALVQDIKPKLTDALKNLEKIEVLVEERDELAEAVVSKIDILHGEYIRKWKYLENCVSELLHKTGFDSTKRRKPFGIMVSALVDKRLISKHTAHELREASYVRNSVVHGSASQLAHQNLSYVQTTELDRLTVLLISAINSKE